MPDYVGTSGDDTIFGSATSDNISGLEGADTLYGEGGADYIDGGDGNDLLEGGAAADVLVGGDGLDAVRGGAGSDVLYAHLEGIQANDFIADAVHGDEGNDVAYIGVNDYFNGGAGSGDRVFVSFDTRTTALNLNFAPSWETTLETAANVTLIGVELFGLYGTVYADNIYGNALDNVFHGGRGNDVLSGAGGTDEIYGGEHDDVLSGGDGDDQLFGEAGNDSLRGDLGVDTLRGGAGDDRYTVYSADDTVIELANEGEDTVFVDFSYTLPDHVEVLYLNGTNGIDANGNAQNNRINGNEARNAIYGLDGDDTLNGGDGNDTLIGGDGNDRLSGDAGDDVMRGGKGNDLYYLYDAGDVITELAGEGDGDAVVAAFTHTLGEHFEALRLSDSAGAADGTGNAANNTLQGNDSVNTLRGQGGNDTLLGWEGDDILYGDDGDDQLSGGEGADMLFGGDGNDTVSYLASTAGVTVDLLTGLVGNGGDATGDAYSSIENIVGSHQNDVLTGNGDANLFEGAGGADTIYGAGGDDTVSYRYATGVTVNLTTGAASGSHAAGDVLHDIVNLSGSSFADVLTGDAAVNRLDGQDGDDILNGAGGNDIMTGGLGNDTYHVGNSGDQTVELAGEGTDTVETALAAYTLRANIENGTMKGTGNYAMTGNSLNNVLRGNSGNNVLDGGSGGADDFYGGAGNDTYYLNSTTDRVFELAGEGYDTVYVNNHFSVGLQDIEEVILTGTLARNLTGGANDNTLRGNSANNVLDGGAGVDTLVGGAGDDTYYVDRSGDVITELASEGTDTVYAASNYIMGAHVENGVVTAAGSRTLTGNDSDNRLTGNIGNDTLNGGGGSDVLDGGAGLDTMAGGAGDDAYYVDRAGDVIIELAGEGVDTVYASSNYVLGANVENGFVNSTGSRTLTGNASNNQLTGNAGNDTLTGGDGADVLTGAGGADRFDFNAAAETAWATYDTITDLELTDLIDLSDIDADANTAGNQAFVLVTAFTGAAGQLRLVYSSTSGDTYVQGDIDGDGIGDFRIRLTGDHTDFANFVL